MRSGQNRDSQKMTSGLEGNAPPNPERFQNFNLLPDESGFRIQNCQHTFYFDIYGGWFDEYNNYYDADGEPRTPPEYPEDDDQFGYDDDIADKFAREYDMGDDDEDDQQLSHFDNIYLNIENKRVLKNYLNDQEIKVEIKNMQFKMSEEEFRNFLTGKRIDYIDCEFEYDKQNRFRGVCYITLDKPNAEKLIEFNNFRLAGREIKINVLPSEEEDETAIVGESIEVLKKTVEETKSPEKVAENKSEKIGPSAPVYVSELENSQKSNTEASKTFERSQIPGTQTSNTATSTKSEKPAQDQRSQNFDKGYSNQNQNYKGQYQHDAQYQKQGNQNKQQYYGNQNNQAQKSSTSSGIERSQIQSVYSSKPSTLEENKNQSVNPPKTISNGKDQTQGTAPSKNNEPQQPTAKVEADTTASGAGEWGKILKKKTKK